MKSTNRPPILFLNVGWMINYDGPQTTDPTRGNFGWLQGHPHGHECYNFSNQNGFCYGSHPSSFNTDITRLGAMKGAESIRGVLVVWFSRDPRTNKAVIVGWYDDAVVYRTFQARQGSPILYGDPIDYKVTASHKDCKLLVPAQRWFVVPHMSETPGGYGQNPNWYGLGESFLNKVWQYIQARGTIYGQRKPRPGTSAPRSNDHEKLRRVEDTAIRIASAYYRSEAGGSREVESVELQNKGWDLEAKGPIDTLFVEVKGLSGESLVAELTPNEYKKMQKHESQWVLFVVTDCLSESPQSYEFRFMHDANRWESASGGVLSVVEKIAAVVSLI